MASDDDRSASVPPGVDRSSSNPERRELRDAPPFFTWRAIYLFVIGALALEIGLGALVTVLYR